MPYILPARALPGELPRLVWLESTGERDAVRITVATGLGMDAIGIARADELETLISGSASCVCSGDIWLERTEDAQVWNLSFVHLEGKRALEIGSFDFTCALQRVQYDRLSLEAAVTVAERSPRSGDLRTWAELATTRAIAFDS